MSIEKSGWSSKTTSPIIDPTIKPAQTTGRWSNTISAQEYLPQHSPYRKYGFIYKTLIWGEINLCYSGNIRTIDLTMDEDVALTWFKNCKTTKKVTRTTVETSFYGRKQQIEFPLLDESIHLYEDVTLEFIDYCVQKTGTGEMNDTVRQTWFKFLENYAVVVYDELVVFKYKPKIVYTTQQTEAKKKTEIVTTVMKEVMDGYFRFTNYKMTKLVEVEIGSKYDVGDGYWSLFGAYTPSLRYAMFADKWSSFNDNKTTDETSGDPIRTLQRRQYQVIKKLGWMNFIAASRRSGKTWLLAFLAVREIIREATSSQEQGRPIRVLYIWLTDKKNKAARDYILRMSEKYRATKMFKRQGEENRLSFVDQENNTLGIVDFISAKDYEAGVGEYADLILIDEAARVKEWILEAILPIVTNEWARLICVSTIDWKTKKNWFYRKVLDWEKAEFQRVDIDKRTLDTRKKYEYHTKKEKKDFTREWCAKIRKEIMFEREQVGLRFTIDDIDYISEREREMSKRILAEYPQRYYAELYSIFPDEWKIFPYERALKEPDKLSSIRYDYIVLWYDPAIMKDTGAVVVVGYDRVQSKIHYIEELEMPRETYNQHPEIMNELRQRYVYLTQWQDLRKVFVVADITGNLGLVSLFETKKSELDLKIWYHAGTQNTRDKNSVHKVSKEYMVDTMKNIMETGGSIVSTACTRMIEEMNYFQIVENPQTGRQWYEAIEWHDDFVNAAMIATYFIYDYMIEKDHIMSRNVGYDEVPEGLTFGQVRERIAAQNKNPTGLWVGNMMSDEQARKFQQKRIY